MLRIYLFCLKRPQILPVLKVVEYALFAAAGVCMLDMVFLQKKELSASVLSVIVCGYIFIKQCTASYLHAYIFQSIKKRLRIVICSYFYQSITACLRAHLVFIEDPLKQLELQKQAQEVFDAIESKKKIHYIVAAINTFFEKQSDPEHIMMQYRLRPEVCEWLDYSSPKHILEDIRIDIVKFLAGIEGAEEQLIYAESYLSKLTKTIREDIEIDLPELQFQYSWYTTKQATYSTQKSKGD